MQTNSVTAAQVREGLQMINLKQIAIAGINEEIKAIIKSFGFAKSKVIRTGLGYVTKNSNEQIRGYIILMIEEQLGLSLAELRKKSRKPEIVLPRQIAATLIVMNTRYSLNETGAFFKPAIKHHTTVIHCRDEVLLKCNDDELFKKEFENMDLQVKQFKQSLLGTPDTKPQSN
jgi:chromosomal replication initiation ATPase DnaA